jgi:3-oxoacyl-[acyl-carrier protein] reductase
MMDICGKTIIVTGGLGAIGTAVAADLSAAGAEIYVFDLAGARSSGSNNDKSSDSPQATFFQIDLSNDDQVEQALAQIPRVDVLINCAGEIYSEPLVNILKKVRHGRDSWDRVLKANLTTAFILSSQVAQKMVSQRVKGLIINFSSIAARGNAGQAAYSAAKAGIEALTNVLAKELGVFKIRAIAIAPGFIDTQSTHRSLSEGMIRHWVMETPMRQLGNLGDIVKTVRYVIECDHLNGHTLAVDGGLRI